MSLLASNSFQECWFYEWAWIALHFLLTTNRIWFYLFNELRLRLRVTLCLHCYSTSMQKNPSVRFKAVDVRSINQNIYGTINILVFSSLWRSFLALHYYVNDVENYVHVFLLLRPALYSCWNNTQTWPVGLMCTSRFAKLRYVGPGPHYHLLDLFGSTNYWDKYCCLLVL